MGGGGEKDLHAAARNGDLAAVQTILSSNPLAVNSRDKHSRTPLHLAAWSGHNEVVSHLCKHKADVGASAMDDMGAIHFAAQKGHLEVVRTLVSSGVSIKAATRKGFTPLHYAAQGFHMELVKFLARKGANLNARTKSGKTPLDLAGNDEVRKVLEECERKRIKGDVENERKTEESNETQKFLEVSSPKPSTADKSEYPGDERGNETAKRKDDGDENREEEEEEASSRMKKAKVALSHLQSMDDTEEGEEP